MTLKNIYEIFFAKMVLYAKIVLLLCALSNKYTFYEKQTKKITIGFRGFEIECYWQSRRINKTVGKKWVRYNTGNAFARFEAVESCENSAFKRNV